MHGTETMKSNFYITKAIVEIQLMIIFSDTLDFLQALEYIPLVIKSYGICHV